MKKLLIPVACLLHICALFWWTLPHSFGAMVINNTKQIALETQLFKWMQLVEDSQASKWLSQYINVTGSQQYWDFFAPHSPKFHQYLSVCNDVIIHPDKENIACIGKPRFSNLDTDFDVFKIFGSGRSRYYRLTENLVNLNYSQLLRHFTDYYGNQSRQEFTKTKSTYLVMNQFELHPNLPDLPKAGYRTDKILWVAH